MKKTKTILALALTFALLLSVGISAFAAGPKYESTKKFVEAIEKEDGVSYMVRDMVTENDKDYEEVVVTLKSDSLYNEEITVAVYFSEDGTEVLAAAPVLKIDEKDLVEVLGAVNAWNSYPLGCSGVRFYVDTDDNTLMSRMDLFTTMNTLADVVPYAVGVLIGYTDQIAYDLSVYAV